MVPRVGNVPMACGLGVGVDGDTDFVLGSESGPLGRAPAAASPGLERLAAGLASGFSRPVAILTSWLDPPLVCPRGGPPLSGLPRLGAGFTKRAPALDL